MEILKMGKPKEQVERKYVKKCFWCKCEFVYTNDDIEYTMEFDQFVVCPCCGLAVGVPLIFKKRYRGGSNE